MVAGLDELAGCVLINLVSFLLDILLLQFMDQNHIQSTLELCFL
jgi:hypothetical protein